MKENIGKLVPFLVCIVFLICSVGAWKFSQNVVDAEVKQNFNQEVEVIKHWIQDRLNLYLPMALGMRIFFESSDSVTVTEWSSYIQKLKLIDKYPAVTSLTYIERGSSNGKDTYIVKYIEPSGGLNADKEQIGLDLSSDQKRLDLFNNIRDEDPTSTGRITLITAPQKGFDIILPVYKKDTNPTTVQERQLSLKGFIQIEFAGDRLFQDIFNAVDSTNLSFQVYSNTPSEDNLLYEQGLDYLAANPTYKPELTTSDTFEFNGQAWYLVASTKPDFKLFPSQERLPLIVLGSGVVASLIFLTTYLYMKNKYKAKA